MSTINSNPSLIIPESEIQDLIDIPKPASIVERITGNVESYKLSALLQELLVNYIRSGETEMMTRMGRHEFTTNFSLISGAIHDLEKHAEDYAKGLCIRQYLQLVTKASQQELDQAQNDIELLHEKYGSLQNGLDNLSEYQSKNKSK